MRVLLIKTSSLGDVIHTLPSLTDAVRHIPGIKFDWVVEESFKEIPTLHPNVDKIIPVAIRRWRKSWLKAIASGEIKSFLKTLRQERYDAVIDAQGLVKSGLISLLSLGSVWGLDRQSAKEPSANLFYGHSVKVPKGQHAVERTRQLFSKALGYNIDNTELDYGLKLPDAKIDAKPFVLFLHGTTWATKHWPEQYWIELGKMVSKKGLDVKLPWGSDAERERAERIAKAANETGKGKVEVLPKMKLLDVMQYIQAAKSVVALDSGLTHLSAALAVPTVSLFGPTNPGLTRPYGHNQTVLKPDFECAPCMLKTCNYPGKHDVEPPCFGTIPPKMVFEALFPSS